MRDGAGGSSDGHTSQGRDERQRGNKKNKKKSKGALASAIQVFQSGMASSNV